MMPIATGSLVLIGAILGSFANVCIWRLPRGESIVWPPSHCIHCNEKITPWQLLPVLSWLILQGKCAYCRGPIPVRYPLVELATALLFGVVGWQWGFTITTLKYCLLSLALIISIGTDFSHQEIPDEVSLSAAVALGAIALITLDWRSLLGGAILFSLLFLVALASRGGMGGGDIKLALAIGLGLGWKLGLLALVIAFLVGGILAVILIIAGKRGKALPFGPFLALGAWGAMFFGETLIDLYITLSLSLWHW